MSNNTNIDKEINEYQTLFSEIENGPNEGNEELERRRIKVVKKLLNTKGIDAILDFACSVQLPYIVGYSLARIGDPKLDEFLPKMLSNSHRNLFYFAGGYVNNRFNSSAPEWADNIPKESWTKKQIRYFLTSLPFERDTWERAKKWLKQDESAYWRNTITFPCRKQQNFRPAIEKLINCGRHFEAIRLLDLMRVNRDLAHDSDSKLIIRALLTYTWSVSGEIREYKARIVNLIRFVKSNVKVDKKIILKIEWLFLPLFTRRDGDRPVEIEFKLATDPRFFCKVIELIYEVDKTELKYLGLKDNNKSQQLHARLMLKNWMTLPGTDSGKFNPAEFKNWLQTVKGYKFKDDRLEDALYSVGNLLRRVLEDKYGQQINRDIAEILDEEENSDLRAGYRLGAEMDYRIFSKPALEKKLAKWYHETAKLIRKKYHRFAETMEEVAEFHEQRLNG